MAFQPFPLPNGSTTKNRIVKAAMEENMANVSQGGQPTPSLLRLYRAWGEGGAGIILSGHVMIDPYAMALPGDVVLAQDGPVLDEKLWRSWASETQSQGAQFWLQINHPGRQSRADAGLPVYAPSPVAVDLGKFSGMYGKPVEMDEEHVLRVIERFAWTARKSEELGFSGVEIHAAHGYLISSFLSPRSNRRTDQWGGSRENRARLLFEVVRAVRKATSPSFGVAVKINTSDFQRGGFDANDLAWVVEQLNTMGLDFLELSGGSVESPAMAGSHQKGKQASTLAREAYFADAAKDLQKVATMPLLITGGIRSLNTLATVIATSDEALAGVGSAFGLVPDLASRWARGEDPIPSTATSWVLSGSLRYAANIAGVQWNMQRIGSGSSTWAGVWPVYALAVGMLVERLQLAQYRKWILALPRKLE